MWQIFPLHNDGLGRKKWVNFPNSQQLEGVPSTNVSWLFLSILIYFFKYIATGKVCAFAVFIEVNKGRGILNGFLRFFSVCLAEPMGNAYFLGSHITENSDSFPFEFVSNKKIEKRDNAIHLSARLTSMFQGTMKDVFFMNKVHLSYTH